MNSFIKLFIDIGPLAVFFIYYKISGDLIDAILPLMLATVISVIISYILVITTK